MCGIAALIKRHHSDEADKELARFVGLLDEQLSRRGPDAGETLHVCNGDRRNLSNTRH